MFVLWKALLNERGEVVAPPTGDPPVVTPVDGNADWRPYATSLRSDPIIAPHLDGIPAKDIPSLIKEHVNLKSHMGKALFLKENPTPEDVRSMRQRAFDMNLFTAPPKTAEEYNFNRPESIPTEAWSDETVGEYRGWANKWGIPQEAVNEGMAIQTKQFGSLNKLFEVNPEEKAQADIAFQQKATESGMSVDEAVEYAGRYVEKHFSERVNRILELTNLSNDPEFMFAIAQAGKDSREDISVDGSTGEVMKTDAEAQALDILTNAENPDHKAFHDPSHPKHKEAVKKHGDLWTKAHPGEITL